MRFDSLSKNKAAVLWTFDGRYSEDGQPRISEVPIEIKVRWERKKVQFQQPDQTPHGYDATAWVDREIAIDSQMRLGTLASLPDTLDNLFNVIDCQVVPDIKGRQCEYVVRLKRKP